MRSLDLLSFSSSSSLRVIIKTRHANPTQTQPALYSMGQLQ